jgi:hypothetical protein
MWAMVKQMLRLDGMADTYDSLPAQLVYKPANNSRKHLRSDFGVPHDRRISIHTVFPFKACRFPVEAPQDQNYLLGFCGHTRTLLVFW